MDNNEKDEASSGKKPPQKQVVVTHYGKRNKPPEDIIPSEIAPKEPTHIVSSPVDIGAAQKSKPESPTATEPSRAASSLPEIEIPTETEAISQEQTIPKRTMGTSTQYAETEPPTEDGSPQEQEPPSGKSSASATIALCLSVLTAIAVIGLGVYTYSLDQEIRILQKKMQQFIALSAQTKSSLADMETFRHRQTSEENTLQKLNNQLEDAQARLIDLSKDTNWVLAKANYLGFMANERLQTAHDATTALAQLIAADEQLKMLGNPAFAWVRDKLAKDIAKLRHFPQVNRHEVWEQLALLSTEINQLHVKRIPATFQDAPKEEQKGSGWRNMLRHSWQELKGLVRVTHEKENKIPIALSEEEQSQLFRILQLLCEQAQWATLQADAKIYLHSLQSLQSWVQEYFADDATKQHLLKEIERLQGEKIEIAIPDISDSVQALSQAMIGFSNKVNQ